jgi:hypothetical protein
MGAKAGIVKMAVEAAEQSTYVMVVTFLDADGTEVTPTSATWTLYSSDRTTVINSREDVALTGGYIVLTGDDLALPNSGQSNRYILVKATYNSATFGNDLSLRSEIQFKITNLGTIDPGT